MIAIRWSAVADSTHPMGKTMNAGAVLMEERNQPGVGHRRCGGGAQHEVQRADQQPRRALDPNAGD